MMTGGHYSSRVNDSSSSFLENPGPGERGNGGSGRDLVGSYQRGKSVRDVWGGADDPAPTDVIAALLKAYPAATRLRCKANSYTPLAYACLVPPPDGAMEAMGGGAVKGGGNRRGVGLTSEESVDIFDTGGAEESAETKASAAEATAILLEEAEEVVRLLLRADRGCASILTKSGLSPLDIHIVSYSQSRGVDGDEEGQEAEGIGRTTTGVLRTLLEADPTLARSRPVSPKNETVMTVGPLELLYSCNAPAFLAAVAREDAKVPKRKTRAWYEDYENPPAKTTVASGSLGNWWAWKWVILLLKYGTLAQKRKGARFMALHAAAGVRGCPLPLLTLAVRAFPKQIRETDEMTGSGNLPLHIVASWIAERSPTDQVTHNRKGMALTALLNEYPEGAKVQNNVGRTPLSLALESGTTWDCGVRKLVRAYPEGVALVDKTGAGRGLYPFMLAATGGGWVGTMDGSTLVSSSAQADPPRTARGTNSTNAVGSYDEDRNGGIVKSNGVVPVRSIKNLADMKLQSSTRSPKRRELMQVRTIYGLLRADPTVMAECTGDDEEEDWAEFSVSGNTVVSGATTQKGWATF